MVKKTGRQNCAVRVFIFFSACDISSRAVMRIGGLLTSFRKGDVGMSDGGGGMESFLDHIYP